MLNLAFTEVFSHRSPKCNLIQKAEPICISMFERPKFLKVVKKLSGKGKGQEGKKEKRRAGEKPLAPRLTDHVDATITPIGDHFIINIPHKTMEGERPACIIACPHPNVVTIMDLLRG